MKKFFDEFKAFISRGNVVDLAVGMVIGSAFTAIVTSLVNNIIMPLVSILTGGISFEQWNIVLGTSADAPVLAIGTFISAIVSFIIIAFSVFLVVKAINTFHDKMNTQKDDEAPTSKKCPYCLSDIPIGASKCAHCASDLPPEPQKDN